VLTAALGTLFAAALLLIAATAAGAGIHAALGRRTWSWTAPAVGLAAITIVGWWAVRLPGHGWTALAAVAALALAGGILAGSRLDGLRTVLSDGLPLAAGALVAACIPFAAEGHFGVLGTGFNVDMSQHLFAADWLADPTGQAPGLFEQGYPLGPHALAAAADAVTGQLPAAFSGMTIALPAIVALTTLAATSGWPRWRAWAAAWLTGFAYLAASLLAQGSFKELWEIALLLGVVLLLVERAGEGGGTGGWRAGVPFGVLGAGTLYSYSSPGLAWPAAALVLWGLARLLREGTASSARAALPAVAAGLLALVLLAAPEVDRITDFGGSVGTVSDSGRGELPTLQAASGSSDGARADRDGPDFDNDLGNLFGQISPLEALNVWPSGDFRVAPGDGAIPAPVFYLGALLGAVALAAGALALWRRGRDALLAALVGAAAIWLAARIASTPYTAAKALAIAAPVAMATSVIGPLAPGEEAQEGTARSRLPRALALAAVFAVAAAGSSLLALANAPVGPTEYSPGVRELSQRFAGRPTQLIAPADVIADQHGREFYSWELREAAPACVEAAGAELLPEIRRVVTVDGADPGFEGLTRVAESSGVVIYRVDDPAPGELDAQGAGLCVAG
jgi:hypothetical protein